VDDEPYIGRIIQLKLEEAPFAVEFCQDGDTALERLRTDDPVDLILLDIMMPNMNGFEVLARLAKSRTASRPPSSCSPARASPRTARRPRPSAPAIS
jgi:CheY-like chemotaxis protein